MITSLLALAGRLFGGENATPYKVEEVYTGLRQQVIGLDEKRMGALKDRSVWAVLMETGQANAAITLLASADGAASLYFSSGGGIIGAGEHENVRAVSLGLVKVAEEFLKDMTKVEKCPLPAPGITVFYVMTPKGIFSYQAMEKDLGEKRDKLSKLFYQGHALIAQMRIMKEQKAKE
jgi:hypothetical protein